MASSSAKAQEQPAPQFYLVELLGTRAGWPENMTADEERVLGEHFVYLKDLTAKGKCLMAGPVWGKFGLVVLKVRSEAEAHEIMGKEPSVVQKVHTYQLSPMVVSLMADFTSGNRYPAEISDRVMYKEVTVKASLGDVWRAWTTDDGAHEFFSPHTKIECRTGGPYEIYFDNSSPLGLRGGEGNKVLSFLPKSMFSFEWNAPPSFGPLRDIRTRVVINFEPVGADSVKVRFYHLGWGANAEWNAIYDYFDKAWEFVLGNFRKRFESGPIEWGE
ncbi:MAG: SRPBCC domain-containing protein [Candidatus Zixiibacteriota bacterium]